jgi:hypothetical protein
VKDLDGDEEDGIDEAFVLVNDAGEIDLDTALMTDDEFVQIMMDSVPAQTTIITICDCCHSGTIMDFNKGVWNKRKAVSISGCRDDQTSGDTDAGGICTHSILLAVASLQRQGLQSYPVKKLFKETLLQDETVFSSEQYITLTRSAGCGQMGIPWPLIPKTSYTPPYRRPSSTGTPSFLHARSGTMSDTASTTTAAPVDALGFSPHRLSRLDMPVAAGTWQARESTIAEFGTRQARDRLEMPVSSSPRLLGQGNLQLQALLSPRVPGGHREVSEGGGFTAVVASQPPVTASLARRQSPSGAHLPAAWPPTGPARPTIPGSRAVEAMQHSSLQSLSYPNRGMPSMSMQKQWVPQHQR